METLRQLVKDFIGTLTSYDYLSFGLTFFTFVLFLVLALMIRHKIRTSAILVFMSFFFLFAGPIIMHKIVKDSLFKHDANVTMTSKLVYSDTLLIKGELHYLGRNPASYCEINVDIYKKGHGWLQTLAHSIKAYKSGYTMIRFPFEKGDSRPFKVAIEPFNYLGVYEVKLDTDCYQ